MSEVDFTESGIVVDARIIGTGLGLDPAEVPDLMRSGRLTSRTETGQEEHAGFHRLTFYHEGRALRLTVDAAGEIVKQASYDAPRRGSDVPDGSAD
jgi:hypothetical protein